MQRDRDLDGNIAGETLRETGRLRRRDEGAEDKMKSPGERQLSR